VPLIRTPRTLPRVCAPAEVDALFGALRTQRDRAMVEAMVLGGLRRCEVLGLRLSHLKVGQRRVFVVAGKGGHQRVVPVSGRFFASIGRYLEGFGERTVGQRVRPGVPSPAYCAAARGQGVTAVLATGTPCEPRRHCANSTGGAPKCRAAHRQPFTHWHSVARSGSALPTRLGHRFAPPERHTTIRRPANLWQRLPLG
jgi:integrase